MLTERAIQRMLFIERRSSAILCLPNYTPSGWWECDLFVVTRSGYMHEIEIKLSVADFRADAKKATQAYSFDGAGWTREGKVKHERLAAGDYRGPSRFWYCVPEGLLAGETLPPWAGLIEVRLLDRHRIPNTIRKVHGPVLHRVQCRPEVVEHAKGVCYWRYWEAISDVQRMAEDRRRENAAAGGTETKGGDV